MLGTVFETMEFADEKVKRRMDQDRGSSAPEHWILPDPDIVAAVVGTADTVHYMHSKHRKPLHRLAVP